MAAAAQNGMLNLPSRPLAGRSYSRIVGMIASTPTSIASTSSAAKPFAPLQIEQRVERRMGARARRIQLHGDAGVDNLPPRAEIARRPRRATAARCPSRREIPAVLRSRPALAVIPRLREQRRDDAVARRQAGMERLHHRAEVFLQAGRLGRGDRERVPGGAGVEAEQRAQAAAAAPIVPSVDVQCQPR